ncbi:MAG: hypothetical protein K6T66_04620 [Peptococcaceae bacterium]|nr:hypothetical protein [Peptococcaceae bacterium]
MGGGAGRAGTGPRAPEEGGLKSPALKTTAFICGIFILFMAVKVAGPRQTAALTAGELKKIYPAEGVLLRKETVIASPSSGRLNMLVQEGERVRAGQIVAEVKTLPGDSGSSAGTDPIRAPGPGVVICRTDGLEGVLNPGQVDILEIAGAKLKAGESASVDLKNGKCDKGQPVMKIVDNLSPTVICLQAPEGFPPDLVKKGGAVFMTWENDRFRGIITDVREYRGRPQLLIQTLDCPGEFLRERKAVLGLEGETVSGCLVSANSLVRKEGQDGLYIMDKNRTRWVPVRVEGVVNGLAAVNGAGVIPGARYVVNPRRFFSLGSGE